MIHFQNVLYTHFTTDDYDICAQIYQLTIFIKLMGGGPSLFGFFSQLFNRFLMMYMVKHWLSDNFFQILPMRFVITT
jgi:hypothetical protein